MRVLLVGNHWTEGPGGAETIPVLPADLLRAAGHEAGRMGCAGWARVHSRHDPASHVAALQAVYRRVPREVVADALVPQPRGTRS